MSAVAKPNQEKAIFYLFAILRLRWKKWINCGNCTRQEKKNPAAGEGKEAKKESDRSWGKIRENGGRVCVEITTGWMVVHVPEKVNYNN